MDRQRKLASTAQLTARNLQSALGSMRQKRDKHAVKARNLQGQLDALDGRVDAEAHYNQIATIATAWEAAEQNQTKQSARHPTRPEWLRRQHQGPRDEAVRR